MILNAYRLAYALAFPFFKAKLKKATKQVAPNENRWKEYQGHVDLPLAKRIWIHCVSVGEAQAAVPFIKALHAHLKSDYEIHITTTTATGSKVVTSAFEDLLGKGITHSYAPFDFKKCVTRFLLNTKPRLLLVMETELWPNWLERCALQGIPVLLLNGRMSEKSAKGYARFSKLSEFIFNAPAKIAAQYQSDANRFVQLGAPISKVAVLGNLKFDLTLSQADLGAGDAIKAEIGNRSILIGASVHPGEDDILLDAHQEILKSHPSALLVIVPRHPKRFEEIGQKISDAGFSLAKRSQKDPITDDTQVYLGDTMGELIKLYQASDFVFIGGSLIQHGGQNMLEPAALSKPLMMGDSRYNFSDICQQLEKAEALIKVSDASDIASQFCYWMDNPANAESFGLSASRVVNANKGAIDKTLSMVKEYLP